jgi:hypothetical protein
MLWEALSCGKQDTSECNEKKRKRKSGAGVWEGRPGLYTWGLKVNVVIKSSC